MHEATLAVAIGFTLPQYSYAAIRREHDPRRREM
jgi:hypothetical protein